MVGVTPSSQTRDFATGTSPISRTDEEPKLSNDKKGLLRKSTEIASLIRDIGVILGVPVLLTLGVKLYDLQRNALEQQIKANEAQIKAVEAQNSFLKESQYDRALVLLKSQKEVFLLERNSLEKQISYLKAAQNTEAATQLSEKLFEAQTHLNSSEAVIKLWESCLRTGGTDNAAIANCAAIGLKPYTAGATR